MNLREHNATCAACLCDLEHGDVVPHCADCVPNDDQRATWLDERDRLLTRGGKGIDPDSYRAGLRAAAELVRSEADPIGVYAVMHRLAKKIEALEPPGGE